MPTLDGADIQGLILYTTSSRFVQHFLFRAEGPGALRAFLGSVTGGNGNLRVTSADEWPTPIRYKLAVGITTDGINLLDEGVWKAFPEEFRAGAVARAGIVGDVGANAPVNWEHGLNTSSVHVVVTVWTKDESAREEAAVRLAKQTHGLAQISRLDGERLKDATDRDHFGYVDGVGQPSIAGGPPPRKHRSPESPVPPGAFLLGHETYGGRTYRVKGLPHEGRNGSFGALRVLQQDVEAFERFLDEGARALGIERELLAAKLCGRWRDGRPLVPAPASCPQQLNWFDFEGDPDGSRCPLGSHIRRMNRRSGQTPSRVRILRRSVPYGPPYDRGNPQGGAQRGMLGLFICASLADQFEFLMREWVHGGPGGHGDPLVAGFPKDDFEMPAEGKVMRTGTISRFVRTRGGAYCFFPSLETLRYFG